MLREMADLGFQYVELSHGVRLSLVPGILRALDEGFIKVASVHNFCPLPVGVMGAAHHHPRDRLAVGDRDFAGNARDETAPLSRSRRGRHRGSRGVRNRRAYPPQAPPGRAAASVASG